MIKSKPHLSDIYRTPTDRIMRTGFLRLDKNEDTIGLPREVLDDFLSGITKDFISTYPLTYRLYDCLSDYLKISEEHLLLASGSDAAIKAAFEVFVSPGDVVVIPDPTYAMFEVYGNLFQADLKRIAYEKDLSFSMEKMIGALSSKTRLAALPNPNSPTGTVEKRGMIIELLDRARELDTVVLIDEAYYPFYQHTVIDLIDEYPNLIVTRTFSKAFGLACARLGYAAAHPQTIKALTKFRPMYEVNGFAVLLGCAALKHPQYVKRNVEEVTKARAYLEKEMKRLGYKTYVSHANFLNIAVGEKDVAPLVEHMKTNGILIKSTTSHETLKKCIRISIGSMEQMQETVKRIEEYKRGSERI